jgi:non-specific serine/threonine protein kinase
MSQQPINIASKNKKTSPGKLLHYYRSQTGLTQSQLALAVGLKGLRMIQYWEADSNIPKAENLKKLIEVFNRLGVFNEGQEREEIARLWTTVQESYDTQSANTTDAYPSLNKPWLEKLLVSNLLSSHQPADEITRTGKLAAVEVPSNLPLTPNRFIGRKEELEKLGKLLLQGQTRLLSLIGPGGMGKTRLSLEVARQLQDSAGERYPDGIWLVELASIADPQLLPQTVAAVLWPHQQTEGDLLVGLTNHLRDKRMLVVLDNCEHLVEASAELVEKLLGSCPNLQVLATSRERLNLASEMVWALSGLSLPLLNEAAQSPVLEASEAVQLFVARAQAVQPGFSLSSENSLSVIQLCRQLDGLPLALELAAARVKGLGLDQLVTRLNNSLQLLGGGSRSSAPRHQTVRALIDWSYDLLLPEEKMLLRRLTVFRGSFSLEAAEAVVTGERSQGQLEPDTILDLLLQLVNKSLVIAEPTEHYQQIRYRLLEMVRQYGQEKLASQENLDHFNWNHYRYFLALAARAEPEFRGTNQAEWLARLERDHDNLRAALAWAMEEKIGLGFGTTISGKSAAELALPLCGFLWRFWFVRGYFSEGRRWSEMALGLPVLADTDNEEVQADRAKVLRGAGILANSQNDYEQALTYLESSQALYRKLNYKNHAAHVLNDLGGISYARSEYERCNQLWGESYKLMREINDLYGMANPLNNLGVVAMHQGDYASAMNLYEESAVIYRKLGEDYGLAHNLLNQGEVARALGRPAQALELTQESLSFFRKLGNKQGIANTLNNLAEIALDLRDPAKSKSWAEESLNIAQELGDSYLRSYGLHSLAEIAQLEGEDAKAFDLYKVSLELRRDTGDKKGIAESLLGMAELAGTKGEWERCARLIGAQEVMRARLGLQLTQATQAELDKLLNRAFKHLGANSYKQARQVGRSFSPEEAVSYALNPQALVTLAVDLQTSSATTGLERTANLMEKTGLTERELEVLALLAQGLTNSQIAEKLIISPHTVNRHITNIYSKLGLTTRAEAVRYFLTLQEQ